MKERNNKIKAVIIFATVFWIVMVFTQYFLERYIGKPQTSDGLITYLNYRKLRFIGLFIIGIGFGFYNYSKKVKTLKNDKN